MSRLIAANSFMYPLCMNSQRPWRKGWQFVCCTALPIAARMCAKKCDELTCAASSLRLRSFQAGSVLWKTPGVGGAAYHPTPNPSPFVVSAPSRECRLWSISECAGEYSASRRRIGEPEYASQRHIVRLLEAYAAPAARGVGAISAPKIQRIGKKMPIQNRAVWPLRSVAKPRKNQAVRYNAASRNHRRVDMRPMVAAVEGRVVIRTG